MSDYRVIAGISKKKLAQRYFVSIIAANGETLFHSEMLKDKAYAIELGQRFAAMLDGNFINAT